MAEKKTILLVDDEKHLLISLRDYLSYENFSVLTARSGEEALRVLECHTPDLIVLDISMPGMGGVGFLKRISNDDGIPRYPVLVLTAHGAMRDFFTTVAVDGFLEKPCEESELIRKIRKTLSCRDQVEASVSEVQKRVLLGDDDPDTAAKIEQALVAKKCKVEIVGSGPEVLDRASVLKPHLIVMKEILPKLNGSAVASLIDVMPGLSMTPVLLFDDTRPDFAESAWRSGDSRCIKKMLSTSDPDIIADASIDLLGQ